MASQRQLETIEGEVVAKYDPQSAGQGKKINFYVQPAGGDRIAIGAWDTDQIAYSVAQSITEGDQVIVHCQRAPNKQDSTKFYLNAKDIILSSAHTSGSVVEQTVQQDEPVATAAPRRSQTETTNESIQRQTAGKDATQAMLKTASENTTIPDDLNAWDRYFFHFVARLQGIEPPTSTDIEVTEA